MDYRIQPTKYSKFTHCYHLCIHKPAVRMDTRPFKIIAALRVSEATVSLGALKKPFFDSSSIVVIIQVFIIDMLAQSALKKPFFDSSNNSSVYY